MIIWKHSIIRNTDDILGPSLETAGKTDISDAEQAEIFKKNFFS